MPCYSPKIRIEDKNKWIKASDGHLYHPAKIQKASTILGDRLEDVDRYETNKIYKSAHLYGYTTIPCGECIGCRLEYSRQWANRGYCESKCWNQNWFITLTYDEDNLPTTDEGIPTLVPEHMTMFMKSLRQIMKRDHFQDNIRFMGCGEYGSERERPHMHLILFNCNFPTESFYKPRVINNEIYYQNKIIERAWKHGISNISECTWNNIAYTARYITKKINGKLEEEAYAENQKKEFFRVSRMPGIGEQYYQEHKHNIYKRDEIIIKNKEGTITTKPPKYFDKLYEKEYPEEFKKIKAKRKKQIMDLNAVKDSLFSNQRLEHLAIEEVYKEEQTQALIRSFENAKI